MEKKTGTNLTSKNRKNKLGLDTIVSEIKDGLNPAKIVEKYNVSKTTLDYSLSKLKSMGCIRKVGYGTWEHVKDVKEVPIRPKGSKSSQIRTSKKGEIRGHAFIWRIEFAKAYDWEKIVKQYKKKTLTFQPICKGKVFRTIFKNRKIWLTKRGMTIYEPIDFFGRSSFEVKGTAVFEMDKLVKGLVLELNEKVRIYRFTTSREHYGLVKNELARQFNDRREKLAIRSQDGGIWLWIDDSKGMSELETSDPNNSRGVQNFWNDHKRLKFKATPSMVLGAIKKNADNLGYHAENMRSHVQAVRDLGAGVEKQNELFERIAKALEGKND